MDQGSNAMFDMAPDAVDYKGTANLRTKSSGFFREPEVWLQCDFILCGNTLHYRASQLPRTTRGHFWGVIYLDEVLTLLPTVTIKTDLSSECRMKIRGKSKKREWKLVFCTATPEDLSAWSWHLSNACNPYRRQQMPKAANNNEQEMEIEAEEMETEDYYGDSDVTDSDGGSSGPAGDYELPRLSSSSSVTSWLSPVRLTGFRERRSPCQRKEESSSNVNGIGTNVRRRAVLKNRRVKKPAAGFYWRP